jgi:hypothetical protein
VNENSFDDCRILQQADNGHLAGALWTDERSEFLLIGSSAVQDNVAVKGWNSPQGEERHQTGHKGVGAPTLSRACAGQDLQTAGL